MSSKLLRSSLLALPLCLLVMGTELSAKPKQLRTPQTMEDTTAWNRYFAAQEAVDPSAAQLWIDRFNYLFNRSRQSALLLRGKGDARRLSGESEPQHILTDSTGAAAGSIGEIITYDDALFSQAIDAIDHGITLHPDRIDMYLGRAAAHMYAKRYDGVAASLVMLIDRARDNKGHWMKANDKKPLVITPEELITTYLQDFSSALFDNPTAEALQALGRLSEHEVGYCETSAIALNNMAAWHYRAGHKPEAMNYFIRASEADPDDPLLIYNIGSMYADQGDREAARIWWSKLLQSSNEAFRQIAIESLRQLEIRAGQ